VAFGCTIDYGLRPGRALVIILFGIVLMTMVYMPVIKKDPLLPWLNLDLAWLKADLPLLGPGAIYKDMPKDQRETPSGSAMTQAGGGTQLLVEEQWPSAARWAFWFSARSAFQIGFQQFSVGDWLARVQSSEFTLRASGWVRTISGLQSLLSLYLVAIWALSYFGRPFG
jgi:hypothetical protein